MGTGLRYITLTLVTACSKPSPTPSAPALSPELASSVQETCDSVPSTYRRKPEGPDQGSLGAWCSFDAASHAPNPEACEKFERDNATVEAWAHRIAREPLFFPRYAATPPYAREAIEAIRSVLVRAVLLARRGRHDEALAQCAEATTIVRSTTLGHSLVMGLSAHALLPTTITACGFMVDHASKDARSAYASSLRNFANEFTQLNMLKIFRVDVVATYLMQFGRFEDRSTLCSDARVAAGVGKQEVNSTEAKLNALFDDAGLGHMSGAPFEVPETAEIVDALRRKRPEALRNLRANWLVPPQEFEKYADIFRRSRTLLLTAAETTEQDFSQLPTEQNFVLRPYDQERGELEVRWTLHRSIHTKPATSSTTARPHR
jgi:hypothetical protein